MGESRKVPDKELVFVDTRMLRKAGIAMSQPTTVAVQILDALHCAPGCTLDALVLSIPELTWNQVFLEVDRLSRTGQVCMTAMGEGTYTLRLPEKDKRTRTPK